MTEILATKVFHFVLKIEKITNELSNTVDDVSTHHL